jgi:hypothetical protein
MTMITQHMLARRPVPAEGPRPAGEIALRSRELARREERARREPTAPPAAASYRPARARRAWAWARALTA